MENNSPPLSESPSNSKYIDELTMKLLSNQTNYAKYLSKTDTLKYEEQQQFIKDCKTHKHDIISMTKTMCNNQDHTFGTDVDDAFNNYARTLVRYLEVKYRTEELQKEYEEKEDDEDTVFPYTIEEEGSEYEEPNRPIYTLDGFLKKK